MSTARLQHIPNFILRPYVRDEESFQNLEVDRGSLLKGESFLTTLAPVNKTPGAP